MGFGYHGDNKKEPTNLICTLLLTWFQTEDGIKKMEQHQFVPAKKK
jgi:hypothetical protein